MQNKWRWRKFLWIYTLEYDGTVYSVINKRKIFTGGYWDSFLPFFKLFEHPDILMIGLGGGTVLYQARKLFDENFNIDIVEISKESVEMTSKLVNLNNENIIIDDGFNYLINNKKKYDLIILDAYQDRKIPEKFYSEDFFLASFNSLKEKGLLLVNYALNGYGLIKMNDFRNNASEYFDLFRIGPTLIEENIIIVCSKNFNDEDLINNLKKLNNFPKKLKRRVSAIKKF